MNLITSLIRWALLGEVGSKWVGVSRTRFASVETASDGGLLARCHGAAGETIQLLAVPPSASQALVAVSHTFAVSGVANILVKQL